MRSYLDKITLVPILEDPSDDSSDPGHPWQEEGMLWNSKENAVQSGILADELQG